LHIGPSIFGFRAKKKKSSPSKSKAYGTNIQLIEQLSPTIFRFLQLDMSPIKAVSPIKSVSKAQVLPKKAVGRKKAVERVKEPDFGLALGQADGQADGQVDRQAVQATSPAKATGKAKRTPVPRKALVPRRVDVRKRVVDQAVEQAQEAVQAPEQLILTQSRRKLLGKVIFEAGKN
jgi:hypothetical protein